MSSSPSPSNHRLDEPEVLLFETSPYQTLDAIVQHDGKSVYFYLHDSKTGAGKRFGTRACWIRNLDQGPYVINEDEMRQGISPMLPRTHCHHPDGQPMPTTDQLKIVWFEEGNGAALIETTINQTGETTETTLGVIPPWSGLEGFHGYAAECAIESPLCWPMPQNPKLNQRIERAREFWRQFQQHDDPFIKLKSNLLPCYDASFKTAGASEPQCYSIDGRQFPPRELVQYDRPNDTIMATVGMSLCPQPAVEIFTDAPREQRRIELALLIPDNPNPETLELARQEISKMAAYPWRHFTWLGAGHTCGFNINFPQSDSALLIDDQQVSKTRRLPNFRDDPVNLLWLVPITQTQQQQISSDDRSFSIEALIETSLGSVKN